jgi:hypothetical protein
VPRNHNFLRLGQPQIARQVILHFRQGHSAGLGCAPCQATRRPRLSRRWQGHGLPLR